MDYIWHVWIIAEVTSSPPTTSNIYSTITLGFGPRLKPALLPGGSVVQRGWYRSGWSLLQEYWRMYDHIWKVWNMSKVISLPPTTPQTCCSNVILVFWPRLKIETCTSTMWYSGPRMMMQVWIYYPTVTWVLSCACAMHDRCEICQRSHHPFQPHPKYAAQLSYSYWSLLRLKSAPLLGGVLIQGGPCISLDILSHCYRGIVWCMVNIWQVWKTSWVMASRQTKLQIWSAITDEWQWRQYGSQNTAWY